MSEEEINKLADQENIYQKMTFLGEKENYKWGWVQGYLYHEKLSTPAQPVPVKPEDEKEIVNNLIQKHLVFDDRNGFFSASVKYYSESGKPSGSFADAIRAMMRELVKKTDNQDHQDSLWESIGKTEFKNQTIEGKPNMNDYNMGFGHNQADQYYKDLAAWNTQNQAVEGETITNSYDKLFVNVKKGTFGRKRMFPDDQEYTKSTLIHSDVNPEIIQALELAYDHLREASNEISRDELLQIENAIKQTTQAKLPVPVKSNYPKGYMSRAINAGIIYGHNNGLFKKDEAIKDILNALTLPNP